VPAATAARGRLPMPAGPWLTDVDDLCPQGLWLADGSPVAGHPELADADWAYDPADEGRPVRAVREVLKAGFWDRSQGDGAGFAAGGVADSLPPGPVLAGLACDTWAAGLDRLTDDELIGVLRAGRRLASWAAAMELAAAGDLWRRRIAEEDAGDTGSAEHTGDEIAASLTLTGRAADSLLDLSIVLRRLPATAAALARGDIDFPRATVIAEELAGLGDGDAAAVERAIIGAAAGQTTTQLRRAAYRAVMAADPHAARKRKEQALREARVERWTETAGTAALAGRDLPPLSVLAADQNLTAMAEQLKAAGCDGTMDTLRASVYLALLAGIPLTDLLPIGPPAASSFAAHTTGNGPGSHSTPGTPAATVPGSVSTPGSPAATGPTAQPSGPGPRDLRGGAFPRGKGAVNLTVPLATWLGLSDELGHAVGVGPLDATDSRDLADMLATRADTRWCLTFTDSAGHPVIHGCARTGPPPRRRRAPPTTGPPTTGPPLGIPSTTGSLPVIRPTTGTPSAASPGTPPPRARGDTWTFTLTWLGGGDCDHARETAAYRPTPTLRHLVKTRQPTCTFPGCARPGSYADLDHTVPFDRGGRTCLCNLAPLCRKHHKAKQTPGWRLDQPQPGVMIWTTPSGRTYTTYPSTRPG
jgi:hypothetical protein